MLDLKTQSDAWLALYRQLDQIDPALAEQFYQINEQPQSHFLIKFKAGRRASPEVVGCLRFVGETTWEERDAAMKRWAVKYRPHQELQEDEAMWLDKVNVEDAA